MNVLLKCAWYKRLWGSKSIDQSEFLNPDQVLNTSQVDFGKVAFRCQHGTNVYHQKFAESDRFLFLGPKMPFLLFSLFPGECLDIPLDTSMFQSDKNVPKFI